MILMEKHIREIMLLRIFPQPDQLIKGIMIMRIKNHLTPKSRIEKQRIRRYHHHTHRIPNSKICRQ